MKVSKSPDEILVMLSEPLDPQRVAKRQGAGSMSLSYIETYDVIESMNRIFGYDGWSDDLSCIEQVGPNVWRATIHITVTIGERVVRHSGVGIGTCRGTSAEELEKCLKETESDALKRAARKLGDQFGNCLYNKDAPEHHGHGQNHGHAQNGHAQQQRPPQSQARQQYAPQRPQQPQPRPPAQVGQTRPIAPQNGNNRQTSPALDGDPVSPINELCRYAGSIGFDNPTPPNIQAALKQSGATFQAVTAGNLALAMTYIKNHVEGPAPADADPFNV